MSEARRPRWALWIAIAGVLALASAGGLWLLTSTAVVPSVVRDPISAFVQPGVTVWWFAFGTLFQTIPSQPGGIAFAAVANGFAWSMLGFVVSAAIRRVMDAGVRRQAP